MSGSKRFQNVTISCKDELALTSTPAMATVVPVMNTLAPTAATASLDARVEDTGGLYAFAFFYLYLGYAYFYFYPSLAGGP